MQTKLNTNEQILPELFCCCRTWREGGEGGGSHYLPHCNIFVIKFCDKLCFYFYLGVVLGYDVIVTLFDLFSPLKCLF